MRFEGFQVENFRNVIDSGWIDANQITAFVGQNESGKSNLFEALYCLNPIIPGATYNLDEDWPVDRWEGRKSAKGSLVCTARFALTNDEITSLATAALVQRPVDSSGNVAALPVEVPRKAQLRVWRNYGGETAFNFVGFADGSLDLVKATTWAKTSMPKFVYVRDYEMSGAQVELDQLKQRLDQFGGNRSKLSNEDQTIFIILDLANIDLDDFLAKAKTSEGRTIRSFDKRSASSYLTNQFANLWRQKSVKFDIDIDGPTLNIFAEDAAIGMPVRLSHRSTGFRWYVSFAWKFTHATRGEYRDCILLLEEPGIHLHFSGQRDLLTVFNRLAKQNTILYTTHLASMIDQANPERVRIVESRGSHLAITEGIVSRQREPMAVIERSLGLTGDMSGLLGNRQVLIIEGGDDSIILHKLSGLLLASGKEGLSEKIYMWPAQGASRTPMYAAFAIGQDWDAGVLLDSDVSGLEAKTKINELYVSKLAAEKQKRFRIFMLGTTVGTTKTDFSVEDLFGDEFYLDCVNTTFGLAIQLSDLPLDGSDMITKRVERVLKDKHAHSALDKSRVLGEMLRKFDSWKTSPDLPGDTAQRAEKLFNAINKTFATT